jgi:hypothetical protein
MEKSTLCLPDIKEGIETFTTVLDNVALVDPVVSGKHIDLHPRDGSSPEEKLGNVPLLFFIREIAETTHQFDLLL